MGTCRARTSRNPAGTIVGRGLAASAVAAIGVGARRSPAATAARTDDGLAASTGAAIGVGARRSPAAAAARANGLAASTRAAIGVGARRSPAATTAGGHGRVESVAGSGRACHDIHDAHLGTKDESGAGLAIVTSVATTRHTPGGAWAHEEADASPGDSRPRGGVDQGGPEIGLLAR